MRERFTASDIRFLIACLLILAVTVGFSAKYFYRAFPEASIEFVVTRDQARVKAEQFLASQGRRVEGYRQASRFNFDNNTKTFLERELGLADANQLMGRRVRLWRWSYRWYRPLQKEEYRVEITTKGETVGFQHLLPETAPGATLPSDQARALAEGFLERAMQRDPAGLEFVESESIARPARTDHVFTWKERDLSVRDATYRAEVTVAGDQIGGYREYLKIPENWLRDYERLRSRNETAQAVDTGVMVLLCLGALVTLIARIGNRDVRWRRAFAFGGAGAALIFLASWNNFPLVAFDYPTTDSYSSFVASRTMQSLLGALAGGALLLALTAVAEPLYRESFGPRLSLGNLFRWRGLRTKSFFKGAALGVTLTGVFVAYQIVFYLTATRLGAWAPADVPYDDLLNTRFPWFFVLLGGFFPAVSEEFLFRMFSIPFLKRLLRSTWMAVVLAGFIWGFGHAGYPNQPFYIRGVEVGIGGVALGLVMLRWGILPTLVWHYSVDALYTALLLLRSHNSYFVLSGAVSAGIVALPLVAAWIAYRRGNGFEPEGELTNEREGTSVAPSGPEAPVAAPVETAYQPWSARRIGVAGVLLAGLIGFLLAPVEGIIDPDFAVTAAKARLNADAFVREHGADPAAFRSVVYVEPELTRPSKCCGDGPRSVGKYFLERRPPGLVKDYCRRIVPLHSWNVRYFKPLQKEEIRVALHPETGDVIGFEHRLPEDSPGADLSADAAREIAANYLTKRAFHIGDFQLKETTSEKKKARRDYSLAWEANTADPRNVDEARYRAQVQVAGDRVVGFRTLWKLPESFLRERSRRNAVTITRLALLGAFLIAAVVAGLWILAQRTRKREVRWRAALAVALPLTALAGLSAVSDFPSVFRAYDTAIPLNLFETIMAAVLIIGLIGTFLAAACGAGLVLALRPDALAAFRAGSRRLLGRDALLAAALGVALALSLGHLRELLLQWFPRLAFLPADAPTQFADAVPALNALSSAATATLFRLALLVLAVYVVETGLRRRWLVAVLALLGIASMVPGQVHTLAEFGIQYAVNLVAAAAFYLFAVQFARGNYLAYALGIWSWSLVSRALEFLSQPAPALRQQGWLLIGALVLTVVWAVAPAFGGDRKAPEMGQAAAG